MGSAQKQAFPAGPLSGELENAIEEVRRKASEIARKHGLNQTDEAAIIYEILASTTFFTAKVPQISTPIPFTLEALLRSSNFGIKPVQFFGIETSLVEEALEYWGRTKDVLTKLQDPKIQNEYDLYKQLKSKEDGLVPRLVEIQS